MTVESAFLYVEESVRLCKELAQYLKKRQAIELEYSKSLGKLAATFQKGQLVNTLASASSASEFLAQGPEKSSGVDIVRGQILKTSFWKEFLENVDKTAAMSRAHGNMATKLGANVLDPFFQQLKEMETLNKTQSTSASESFKNLQDALADMKKAKKELDTLQTVAIEANQNHQRAQHNSTMKEKDITKLSQKAAATKEKADHAADTYLACEQLARAAEEDYTGRVKPKIYADLQSQEETRLRMTKNVLAQSNMLEMKMFESHTKALREASDSIQAINLSNDVDTFFKSHMANEEDPLQDSKSVGLSPGELKRGTLLTKKDDVSVNWKPKFVIFREDECALFIYDSVDTPKPREWISVQEGSVHRVDNSFFGKPCFQLVVRRPNEKTVYNFITETEADRDDWVNVLRHYTSCCIRCATVFGYDSKQRINRNLVNPNAVKFCRSFQLKIVEAKELRGPGGSRNVLPYCIVLFDDIKFGRTTTKSSDNPLWGEAFTFSDLAPHFTRLRVALFTSNRVQRDTNIGYVSINLLQLKSGVRFDNWVPIQQLGKADEANGQQQAMGSIRISYSLNHDYILPADNYAEFLELVTEPSFTATKLLGKLLVNDREEFSRTFLNLLFGLKKEREGLYTLIRDEVQNTEDPNIIFRGNTLTTKIVDQYMRCVGQDYLYATLSPLIKTIMSVKESCEIDPSRETGETSKKNIKRLIGYVTTFWNTIQKSAKEFPLNIVEIFQFLKNVVSEKFGTSSNHSRNNDYVPVKYPAISGFLFLRFFCPAILAPRQFGLSNDIPDSTTLRTLTLIVKILQNLANLTEFGLKDVHMSECNQFIKEQKDNMKAFLDKVSTVTPDTHAQVLIPAVDVTRQCEALYQFFERHMNLLTSSPDASQPILRRLVPAVDNICRVHERVAQGWQKQSEALMEETFTITEETHVRNPTTSGESRSEASTPLLSRSFSQLARAVTTSSGGRHRQESWDALSPPVPPLPTRSSADALDTASYHKGDDQTIHHPNSIHDTDDNVQIISRQTTGVARSGTSGSTSRSPQREGIDAAVSPKQTLQRSNMSNSNSMPHLKRHLTGHASRQSTVVKGAQPSQGGHAPTASFSTANAVSPGATGVGGQAVTLDRPRPRRKDKDHISPLENKFITGLIDSFSPSTPLTIGSIDPARFQSPTRTPSEQALLEIAEYAGISKVAVQEDASTSQLLLRHPTTTTLTKQPSGAGSTDQSTHSGKQDSMPNMDMNSEEMSKQLSGNERNESSTDLSRSKTITGRIAGKPTPVTLPNIDNVNDGTKQYVHQSPQSSHDSLYSLYESYGYRSRAGSKAASNPNLPLANLEELAEIHPSTNVNGPSKSAPLVHETS